jgi:octaprenyl-diphosphate synthase
MRQFGECLGMAFQIVDDVLDFTGEEEATGKPAGLDLREHKVTLPLIHALPKMSVAQRTQVEALMDDPQPNELEISRVVVAVTERGGLEYARERAQAFCERAETALEAIRPSPARETLRASLTYVLERRR